MRRIKEERGDGKRDMQKYAWKNITKNQELECLKSHRFAGFWRCVRIDLSFLLEWNSMCFNFSTKDCLTNKQSLLS